MKQANVKPPQPNTDEADLWKSLSSRETLFEDELSPVLKAAGTGDARELEVRLIAQRGRQPAIRDIAHISGIPISKYLEVRNTDGALAAIKNRNEAVTLSHLIEYAESRSGLSPALALSIARDIGRVVHRVSQADSDASFHGLIVPELIEVGVDGTSELFGWEFGPSVCRRVADDSDSVLARFIAPEVLNHHPCSVSSDIYSLTMVLFRLIARSRAKSALETNAYRLVLGARDSRGHELAPRVTDLLLRGLAPLAERLDSWPEWTERIEQAIEEITDGDSTEPIGELVHSCLREGSDARRKVNKKARKRRAKHLTLIKPDRTWAKTPIVEPPISDSGPLTLPLQTWRPHRRPMPRKSTPSSAPWLLRVLAAVALAALVSLGLWTLFEPGAESVKEASPPLSASTTTTLEPEIEVLAGQDLAGAD